jgi:hypothetical protein
MHTIKNPTVPKHRQQFRSFAEMLHFAHTAPTALTPAKQTSRDTSFRGTFHDFRTWEACYRAGGAGWPEMAAQVQRLVATVTEKVLAKMVIPDLAYHDEGLYLDGERYREGDPECLMKWVDTAGEVTGQQEFRIIANMCVSGSVENRVLQLRGAAIIALANALELVGRRVEVAIVANTADTIETSFIAKPFGEPCQIDQLAFSVASADMFRRCLFACWERAPEDLRQRVGAQKHGGYGMVRNAHYVDDTDLVLSTEVGNGGHFQSPDAAVRWVLAQLEAQGVTVATAA